MSWSRKYIFHLGTKIGSSCQFTYQRFGIALNTYDVVVDSHWFDSWFYIFLTAHFPRKVVLS